VLRYAVTLQVCTHLNGYKPLHPRIQGGRGESGYETEHSSLYPTPRIKKNVWRLSPLHVFYFAHTFNLSLFNIILSPVPGLKSSRHTFPYLQNKILYAFLICQCTVAKFIKKLPTFVTPEDHRRAVEWSLLGLDLRQINPGHICTLHLFKININIILPPTPGPQSVNFLRKVA
jgi:hypothetical protein